MEVMEKEIEEVYLKVFGDRGAKRQLEDNDVNCVWVYITAYLKA